MPEASPLHCPVCAGAVSLVDFQPSVAQPLGVLAGTCRGCGAGLLTRWDDRTSRMDVWVATPGGVAADPTRVRQANASLDALLRSLDERRAEMRDALKSRPSDAVRQGEARRTLLDALEAYVAALARRNLPVPPRLRDELSLQRGIAVAPDGRGRFGPGKRR